MVGAGGAGYYVAHIETVPYTHRRHAVLVSPATERALGADVFKQVSAAGIKSISEGSALLQRGMRIQTLSCFPSEASLTVSMLHAYDFIAR